MIIRFTTTNVFGTYHHERCELESRPWRDVLDTIVCDLRQGRSELHTIHYHNKAIIYTVIQKVKCQI
jgi:hypothetical protein